MDVAWVLWGAAACLVWSSALAWTAQRDDHLGAVARVHGASLQPVLAVAPLLWGLAAVVGPAGALVLGVAPLVAGLAVASWRLLVAALRAAARVEADELDPLPVALGGVAALLASGAAGLGWSVVASIA